MQEADELHTDFHQDILDLYMFPDFGTTFHQHLRRNRSSHQSEMEDGRQTG
jgi:hypothetical protein